ncbi:hypothetical protein LZ198_20110 [Myxococcus sp. K15C18031901]|uniref:hypothetical protein n=1 Tax=Myxococcus dinghuensis TaxID=2906761 RepID=UPI0020A6F7AA|nr:hypothetical protein [Myxococcus dinghuensis]MCP3101185.1 hypothetical protein [Myxococcus dinghuensis]
MLRSMLVGVALVLGLGAGFVAGARPAPVSPEDVGPKGFCTINEDCDVKCGVGLGRCVSAICRCL